MTQTQNYIKLMASGLNNHRHTIGFGRVVWLTATLVTLLNVARLFSMSASFVVADDSAAAPAFDIGALASLASNIGSNPQIMNIVSSLLTSNSNQKPALSSSSSGSSGGGPPMNDMSSVSDLESNSIVQSSPPNYNNEPLRRAMKTSPSSPEQQSQAQATSPASPAATPASQSNPVGGLMSMLPGLMSSLGSGGGNGSSSLSGLGGLLSSLKRPQAVSTSPVSTSSTDQSHPQQQTTQTVSINQQQQSPQAPAQVAASTSGSTTAPTTTATQQSGMGPAHSVVNQVLTAYASGQIPNELIQLGLSGRVPPQIIDLALTGQVPPQMIQMIITGQVPMSTINAFLSAMQQASASKPTTATVNGGAQVSNSSSGGSVSGVFATTRSLFETLLKRDNSGKPSVNVPTILGSIIKMPSLPNMRSLGQMVGGSITNMASMIPF